MTCLSGDRLVPKTHGRIVFRGLIDTLEAEIIEAQVLAADLNRKEAPKGRDFCSCLEEILACLRLVMAAEVRETPLEPPVLFGMGAGEIHRLSHWAKITGGEESGGAAGGGALGGKPSYTQGPLAARLNTLRARVREAELFAVKVFGPQGETALAPDAGERGDIILVLNRLSSALWWLFCECANANTNAVKKEDPE